MLRYEDLTTEEQALVYTTFMARVRHVQSEDIVSFHRTYTEVLHEWGVMCPHHQAYRLYDGWTSSDTPVPFEESRWFRCSLCDSLVINR